MNDNNFIYFCLKRSSLFCFLIKMFIIFNFFNVYLVIIFFKKFFFKNSFFLNNITCHFALRIIKRQFVVYIKCRPVYLLLCHYIENNFKQLICMQPCCVVIFIFHILLYNYKVYLFCKFCMIFTLFLLVLSKCCAVLLICFIILKCNN